MRNPWHFYAVTIHTPWYSLTFVDAIRAPDWATADIAAPANWPSATRFRRLPQPRLPRIRGGSCMNSTNPRWRRVDGVRFPVDSFPARYRVPSTQARSSAIRSPHQLTGKDWLGLTLTVGGVVWVVLERPPNGASRHDTGKRWPGILLGLGGAVGQAVGLVLSKYGMGSYNAFAATQIRVLAGIVGFALMFSAVRWWPRVHSALVHRSAMARISLGAVFGPFLGVSLSLLAVQHTTTGVATAIMSIVAVLIIVPTILIYKVRLSPRAMVGAVLAVGGVVLLFM